MRLVDTMRPILWFSSLVYDGDNKKLNGARPVNDAKWESFYEAPARIFRKGCAAIRVGNGFCDCVHDRIPEPNAKITLDA